MSTLWTFGDSYTFGAGCREDAPVYLPEGSSSEYYDKFKTETDEIFPNILGKMLDMDVKNLGVSAVSNDYIIDLIIDNWFNFKKGDCVVVQITFHSRIDIPYNGKLETPYFYEDYPNNFPLYKAEEIETIINFQYHFCDNILYKKRNTKRFNFLHKLLKEKKLMAYFWDVADFARSSEFEKISMATNGKILDEHFSFNGHKHFADTAFKKITNPNLI